MPVPAEATPQPGERFLPLPSAPSPLGQLVVFDVYGCICLSSVVFVCPWMSSLVCESFVIMLSGRVGRRADANIGFVAFTAKAELTFPPTFNLVKILLYEGCFF